MTTTLHCYAAKSVRVVDGDTLDITLQLGFHVDFTTTLRLNRINAAEHGTPSGDAATAYLTQRLANVPVVIQTVQNTLGVDEQEKYGRWLAEVWVNDVNINDEMVATGHAVAYSGHGPKPVPAQEAPDVPVEGA